MVNDHTDSAVPFRVEERLRRVPPESCFGWVCAVVERGWWFGRHRFASFLLCIPIFVSSSSSLSPFFFPFGFFVPLPFDPACFVIETLSPHLTKRYTRGL